MTNPDCKLSTNEKAELLPCPFCGGKAYVEKQMHNSVRPDDYVCGCNSSVCKTLAIIIEDATEQGCIDKWNTRAEPQSKHHKVCPQCQQVRPLAEFGDDAKLINDINLIIIEEKSAQASCHPDDVEDCNKYYMNKIITLIRNHDKSSHNQVLDEVVESLHKTLAGYVDEKGISYIERERGIKAIEGLKQ